MPGYVMGKIGLIDGLQRCLKIGRKHSAVSHQPSAIAQHQQHFFDRVVAVFGAAQAVLRNRRHVHGLAWHPGATDAQHPWRADSDAVVRVLAFDFPGQQDVP